MEKTDVRLKVAEELQRKWLEPEKIRGWLASTGGKIPPEAQQQIAETIQALFAEYGLRPDLGHIVILGDRPYITREGLLYYARKSGQLAGIEVEIVEKNKDFCLVKATVLTKDGGKFEAFGDASTSNTNRMVSPHLIRMAETRAINRALREAFPIGLCSYEELQEEVALQTQEEQEDRWVFDEYEGEVREEKKITEQQRKKIIVLAKQLFGDAWREEIKNFIKVFGKESSKELSRKEASEIIESLLSMIENKKKKEGISGE